MILGGRAADLLGRRRVFLIALAVFVIFSALGGLAQESWVLILVRFITGATAGSMTTAGFGLLTASFAEGPRRNKALAIYGAIGASGFLLGVVVGGVLTAVGWRWVFFAPAVIEMVFLITGLLAIPKPVAGSRDASGRFDFFGAITLTAAMVTLVFGIVTVGEEPGNALGISALIAGVALFIRCVERSQRPLPLGGNVQRISRHGRSAGSDEHRGRRRSDTDPRSVRGVLLARDHRQRRRPRAVVAHPEESSDGAASVAAELSTTSAPRIRA